MYNHASNLEFEDAAKIRDQINELQEKYLMLPKAKNIMAFLSMFLCHVNLR